MDHVAAHIGKPEIASRVTISQLRMIQAQQVQHRGLQIMDVHRILDRLISELIACTIDDPRSDAAACKNNIESVRIVIAARPLHAFHLTFGRGHSAKLAAHYYQCLIKQSSNLQIGE